MWDVGIYMRMRCLGYEECVLRPLVSMYGVMIEWRV